MSGFPKITVLIAFLFLNFYTMAQQVPVNFAEFNKRGDTKAVLDETVLTITWPAGASQEGRVNINLEDEKSLFSSHQ